MNNLFSLIRNPSSNKKLRASHSFAETEAAAEVSGEAPDRDRFSRAGRNKNEMVSHASSWAEKELKFGSKRNLI